MNTCIVDLQYFAGSIYYLELNRFTYCIFDACVVPPKASFFNRCRLVGANGVTVLSIPLLGGRGQKKMARDIRIANFDGWQAQHWKTLFSAYNRSPWFEHYAEELEGIYNKKVEWLVDWNMTCHQWICDKLSIRVKFSLAKNEADFKDIEAVDRRFFCLPGQQSNLQLKRYPQVFEERHGFTADLSILDWLFCMGPEKLPELVAF